MRFRRRMLLSQKGSGLELVAVSRDTWLRELSGPPTQLGQGPCLPSEAMAVFACCCVGENPIRRCMKCLTTWTFADVG